jgi:hypothetical protein
LGDGQSSSLDIAVYAGEEHAGVRSNVVRGVQIGAGPLELRARAQARRPRQQPVKEKFLIARALELRHRSVQLCFSLFLRLSSDPSQEQLP